MSGLDVPGPLAALVEARREQLGAFATHGRWLRRTGSTNDDAARWALEGAPEGAWVVADEQTAGRGRRGRGWVSDPGTGLYVSVVFRPAVTPGPVSNDPATSLLTLMAGVAAIDAIRRTAGVPVTLKWPNDVVVDSAVMQGLRAQRAEGAAGWRKVAGILAEGSGSGSALNFVIVGVGVNLRAAGWPADVAARATSLETVAGREIDRDVMLVELLGALAHHRARLLEGGASALRDRWRAYAPSSDGHRVSWTVPDGRLSGVTAGIDVDGALLVRTARGCERVVAGELAWE